MTLTEFLLARIAEDEAAAAMMPDHPTFMDRITSRRFLLAECKAKRRIVEEHGLRRDVHERDHCEVCRGEDADGVLDEWTNQPWPCRTLRAHAAVYADHPEYCEEWTP